MIQSKKEIDDFKQKTYLRNNELELKVASLSDEVKETKRDLIRVKRDVHRGIEPKMEVVLPQQYTPIRVDPIMQQLMEMRMEEQ